MKNKYSRQDAQAVKKSKEKNDSNIPGPVFATNGAFKGEVYLQWDSFESAQHYIVEVSKNGSGKWQQVDIIKEPHYSLGGLKSSKEYSFRIAAISAEGRKSLSEPVSKKIK